MLAPDQRNDIAKALAVQVDQALAMPVLLDRHAVEDRRRGGEVRPKAVGKTAVDAGVILFGRDRQRKDFLFGEIAETAAEGQGGKHGRHLSLE
jgi:hypothetical protein